MAIDFTKLPTPCYIVDEELLLKNLLLLKSISDRTACKILLAQKAFSMYSLYPLIGSYLNGSTASSLFEAKLGKEEMEGEVHIFSPAYREEEMDEILSICDHVVFNSFRQWKKYREKIKTSPRHIECGLRINPEYSEIETNLYDPCFENSRLGTTLAQFEERELEGIDGFHFHTLCEQNSDTLERTIEVVEKKFGSYLSKLKWINFGGGHHITREDYDIEKLIKCITYMKEKYQIEVYLEPGEAVALNTGYLVSKVLEVEKNGMNLAIMDTSATCHMPDVLEMPYRPEIIGAKRPDENPETHPYVYRLGSGTCLAGDIIGDYAFEKPFEVGDVLVFTDMAHYTMVKNNTFNGINLPTIASYNKREGIKIIKTFNYLDFKERLS